MERRQQDARGVGCPPSLRWEEVAHVVTAARSLAYPQADNQPPNPQNRVSQQLGDPLEPEGRKYKEWDQLMVDAGLLLFSH